MQALQLSEEERTFEAEVDEFLDVLSAVASGTLQATDVVCNSSTMRHALDTVSELRANYDELYRSAEQWAVPAPVAKEAQVRALDLIEKLNLGYVRGRIVQIMLLLPGVGMQVKAALINEVEELTAHLARRDP
jgi:hypothetical protein